MNQTKSVSNGTSDQYLRGLMQNIYFCKFDTEVFLFAQADSHQFNILCQMPIEPAGENRILSTSIDFELNGYVKYKHSYKVTSSDRYDFTNFNCIIASLRLSPMNA